jgi:hypothetical protein
MGRTSYKSLANSVKIVISQKYKRVAKSQKSSLPHHHHPPVFKNNSNPSLLIENLQNSSVVNDNYSSTINFDSLNISQEGSSQNGIPIELMLEDEISHDIPKINPLFDKSKYSVIDASRLIVSYALRFSLSDQASKNLVDLIKLLLPEKNNMLKSYNKMFKSLISKENKIKVKNYCIFCSYELDNKKNCQNIECDKYETHQFPYDTFHYVDIKNQLEEILSSYWTYIENYKKSEIKNLDFINSSFYKEKPNTIHLYLCTDGVPVFKQPSRSAYPVYLNIIELPPFLRETKRTKLIAGVWFGTNQPTSDILFSQLISNVNSLDINISPNGENLHLKAKLHIVQGDLPGKAKMLDMKTHKGFFCCPYCFMRGNYFNLLVKIHK